jgi:hypothetical protein
VAAAASGGRPAGAADTGAAPPAGKPAADALVTFPDVKLYQVVGKRTTDTDAVLNFSGGQLLVMPSTGGAAMATVPFKRITHATYVHARDPKWDPTLATPPDAFGIGGLIRTARHWLVLQGPDHIEILRLDDSNFGRILEAFESRTGIKIDRPK